MKILPLKNEGVYVIQNTFTQESYIGSSKNIGARISKHMSLLKHDNHSNSIIQESYNKYGSENFTSGVLEYVTKDLEIREQFYIDTYKPTFNITTDAIRNTPSLSSRVKMSNTRTRLLAEGKIKKVGCRPILVYDLEGNFVKEFSSVVETARELGIHRGGVNLVLNGKYKQIKGNVFKYKSDLIKSCELLETPEEGNQQPSAIEI